MYVGISKPLAVKSNADLLSFRLEIDQHNLIVSFRLELRSRFLYQ